VTPAGSPGLGTSGVSLSADDGSITINGTVSGDPNGSSKVPGSPYLFIASEDGDPVCTNSGGATIDTNGNGSGSSSTTQTIDHGLTQFHTYTVYACYTNAYGAAEASLGSVTVWSQPAASWRYSITNHGGGSSLPDFEFNGSKPFGGSTPKNYVTEFSDATMDRSYEQARDYSYPTGLFGPNPNIKARNCGNGFLGLCTNPTDVTASGAPYQLQATGVTASCQADATSGDITGTVSLTGKGLAQASVGIVTYTYLAAGATDPTTANGNGQTSVTLPSGATHLQVTSYQINLPSGFDGTFVGDDGLTNDSSCN
jgi:hypothetical protein